MFVGLLQLFSLSSISQELLTGKGNFNLDFDVARFYGDTQHVFVELYYSMAEHALTYKLESGRYTGTLNMKYIVRTDSGIVASKQWLVPHMLDDSLQLGKNRVLTGLESVALPPGTYSISLLAYDVNETSRQDSSVIVLPVYLYPKDKEVLSDIELCTSIQASTDKQSIFHKNTLEVIPNTSRLFGTGLPIMYYYFEVYNLALLLSQSSITVRCAVLDATGREVITRDKTKQRLRNASVEVGTMNLSAVKSGTYLFRVSLIDSISGVLTSTSKKFFIYRPGAVPESLAINTNDYSSSEFAFMSQIDIDKEFEYVKYIASEVEREQYKLLTDLKARQNFLFEFWKRRDPNPASTENEYKREYYERIQVANRSFTTGMREGWNSDRGRVLIVYGQYDEIERVSSTSESNPYETWHYQSLQGGVIFVFVDRNNLNEYSLVHSTHRNELRDENWYQQYALKAR